MTDQREVEDTGRTGTTGAMAWPSRKFRLALHAGWSFEKVATILERELEAGRGVLWLPVLFGFGVVAYFNLPAEPSVLVMSAVAIVLSLLAWRNRETLGAYRILVAAAAIVAGIGWMTVRTAIVAAPVLHEEIVAEVDGWVVAREAAARGGIRVLIKPVSIDSIAESDIPRHIRVTIRSDPDSIAVGDGIHLLARLRPPSGPTHPGGYDFARADFFDQVGAVGFAYGAAHPTDLGEPPISVRAKAPIAHLRRAIRERVLAALPGDRGQIAAALIMGDRRGIPERIQEVMRESGLGHVLAISGLHMALVSGSAFWLIRAVLALSPGLALRYPIRKWAAAGALGVAAFYLTISGASVATQRAFIMMSVMLIAILIGRRALTVRNVALSAMIVLLLEPESVLSASFQMSFAATLALVVGYEIIQSRREGKTAPWVGANGVGRRIAVGAAGLTTTSLIAGLATTPFAIYHFHRAAPLTLIANLAAMPVVGLIIMPMALFAVLAMPFGMEAVPLAVMGWGLSWVIGVATNVSAWSHDWGGVSAFPASALAVVTVGFLWLCLWSERWRWAGLVAIPVAAVLIAGSNRPDFLIDREGGAIAVRGELGRYIVVGARDNRFVVENWLRADADTRPVSDRLGNGSRCDTLGCIVQAPHIGTVAIASDPMALGDDCLLADLVIANFDVPESCKRPKLVIDREALRRGGAHALTISEDGAFAVTTAYPPAGRRPFMPPSD